MSPFEAAAVAASESAVCAHRRPSKPWL